MLAMSLMSIGPEDTAVRGGFRARPGRVTRSRRGFRAVPPAMTATAAVCLLAAAAQSSCARAQSAPAAPLFTQPGMLSGTGAVFVPSTATVPQAEWRAAYSRLEYLGTGMKGLNSYAVHFGLSTHFEAYARLNGEQIPANASVTSYTLGAKYRPPGTIPFGGTAAGWFESTLSEQESRGFLLPSDAVRGGVTAEWNAAGTVSPGILAGVTSFEGSIVPLAGGTLSVLPGSGVRLTAEYLWSYAEERSHHGLVGASVRVFPYLALTLAPGVILTPGEETWMFSVGFSLTTSPIDFRPEAMPEERKEFRLPKIEELLRGGAERSPDGGRASEADG